MKFPIFNTICALILITSISLSCIMISASMYTTSSTRFLGQRIYLDPGHGGKDNGASFNEVLEDELNLAITTIIYEGFLDEGASVQISRLGDYDLASLYASNRKREDLAKRLDNMNKFKPDFFLSIHMNIYSSESVYGGQVFYRKNDDKSKALAENIQDSLNTLNATNKKARVADFYFFNRSSHLGVLIECGFISSSRDREKLKDYNYQVELSRAIMDGVEIYQKIGGV